MGYNNNSDGVYLSNPTGGNYEGYNKQGGIYESGITGGEYEDQESNQVNNSLTRAETAALAAKQAELAAKLSETNASDSANSASTSATDAAASAIAAASSASSASASASTATTKASEASTSASSASTSAAAAQTAETNAETAETNAAASASSASTSASTATTQAGIATTQATNASVSATSAANTLLQVEQIFDNFDDIYLGSKASDPTLDNDGDPLVAGQVYWNTTESEIRFYNGTAWERPEYAASQSALAALNSANAAASSATASASSATTAGGYATSASNSAGTATTQASNALTSANNADTSEANALASADAADISEANALTYSNNASASATAADASADAAALSAADAAQSVIDAGAVLSSSLLKANNLSDLASVSTARANLGLGTAATTDSTAYATAAQGASADTAYSWGNHASAGYAVGPASSTDNAITRFDATTGKLLQNSVVTIDDTGNEAGILSQQFADGTAVTVAAGKQWYNATTGSWNLGMGNGNITQQVGEEIFVYGKASAAITEGQLICKTGTVGGSGVITFAPAPASLVDNDGIIGVATEDIALNAFGRITYFGIVRGIDTSGSSVGETWVDNDTLWYNPAGAGKLTKTKPTAPNIKYSVATVINAASGGSGSIQVNLQAGSTLGGTDSNVQLTSETDTQLLQYYGAGGYWRNVAASSVADPVGTAVALAIALG